MADITVTAPVTRQDGDLYEVAKAQVAINAGQAVYKDTSNANKFNLCDADVEASAAFYGIAISSAGVGEDCVVARPGALITVANTPFVIGTPVLLSTTAGGFTSTPADLLTGDFVTIALWPLSTSTARVVSITTEGNAKA